MQFERSKVRLGGWGFDRRRRPTRPAIMWVYDASMCWNIQQFRGVDPPADDAMYVAGGLFLAFIGLANLVAL